MARPLLRPSHSQAPPTQRSAHAAPRGRVTSSPRYAPRAATAALRPFCYSNEPPLTRQLCLSLLRRYFRVTLPLSARSAPGGDSFAFMFSCEDAAGGSDGRGTLSGVGAQVMGPGDAYLCRHARDVAPFWAWRHRLGLGHAFATNAGAGTVAQPKAQKRLRQKR